MKGQLLSKLAIIVALASLSQSLYCSSQCIDYLSSCFDDTPQGCYACDNRIYNLKANVGSTTPCSLLNQTSIIINQLPNTGMSLAGYTSTQASVITCTNYTFSGQYTSNDYLYKNFTNIPLNHYALIIKFSVGYIGTWSQTNYLRLNMKDSIYNSNYDYEYRCYLTETIYGPPNPNTSDCIRHRSRIINHNSSFIQLNFTALTTQADPNIQFWGIKQLIIAAKLCHDNCLTCFADKNSDCLTCRNGFYLQGNVCLPTCDNMYKINDSSICVSQCPSRYYPNVNSYGQKQCLNCQTGCEICSNSIDCKNLLSGTQNSDSWNNKMQLWILLIIIGISGVVFIIYKCFKCKGQQKQINKKMLQNSDQRASHEQNKEFKHDKDIKNPTDVIKIQQSNDSIRGATKAMMEIDQLWFNELEQMEPKQIKIRKRLKRAKDQTNLVSQQNIQLDQVIGQSEL